MAGDEARSWRDVLRAAPGAVATLTVFAAGCTDRGGSEPDDDVENVLLATGEEEGEAVWIGREPSDIEDETNPTLELVDGWQYEIGYVNNDGERHGLSLWAGDEERHATNVDDEEGAEQWLRIEATDDLTSYRCEVNPETMKGDIEVHE